VPPECVPQPAVIAFVKEFGTTIGLIVAGLSWLVSRLLGWSVWTIVRFLERYEMMRAIHAEITDTQRYEDSYSGDDEGRKVLEELKLNLPGLEPLAPYVTVNERQMAIDGAFGPLRLLSSPVINAVVAYYGVDRSLSLQLQDYRSETFRSISRERQEAVILSAYKLGGIVKTRAREAITALDEEMKNYRAYLALLISAGICFLLLVTYIVAVPTPIFFGQVSEAVIWARSCEFPPTPGPAPSPRPSIQSAPIVR